MPAIQSLSALEILDSRGRPTVKTTCTLRTGVRASASVPSGASTGTAEALELRDGEPARYRGLGCRRAVAHVNRDLNTALAGREFAGQAALDQALLELDGTPNKARLGANALLSVSLAFARAVAAEAGQPLYASLAGILGEPLRTLPRPTINLFSGGKHAGGQVSIQDVLVVPAAARTLDEALAVTYEVYQRAAELTQRKYGTRALTADEGGLAPPFPSAEAMIADAVAAIAAGGFTPGRDVALAVDVASTHFFREGRYHPDGATLTSEGMIERVAGWLDRFPIVSVEDALAEEDWAAWPVLRARLAGRALVLGDDFLCTHPARIRRAIAGRAADALLLKVNQVGTLSEAAEACRLARAAGWRVTVSARSGETEDDWLADLAVGWSGDQIKVGSITQSERLAKYNRLLEIEAASGLPLAGWPGTAIP
jgi:enolase